MLVVVPLLLPELLLYLLQQGQWQAQHVPLVSSPDYFKEIQDQQQVDEEEIGLIVIIILDRKGLLDLILDKFIYCKFVLPIIYTDATCVPGAEMKMNLVLAGLGDKRISMNQSKSYTEFDDILKSNFKQLVGTGGYEILRTERNSKELRSVPVPPEGYNSDYLKSVLGQANGYVRPLQKDINIEDDEETEQVSTNVRRNIFYCGS